MAKLYKDKNHKSKMMKKRRQLKAARELEARYNDNLRRESDKKSKTLDERVRAELD